MRLFIMPDKSCRDTQKAAFHTDRTPKLYYCLHYTSIFQFGRERFADELLSNKQMVIITTGRAGGLHKPPWGLSRAEPIGSSNRLPIARISRACP